MSSIRRSSNCSKYTDRISLMIEADASIPGTPDCSVALPLTFSCQSGDLNRPDAATTSLLAHEAQSALQRKGCPIGPDAGNVRMTYRMNAVGARRVDKSAKELRDDGTATNCGQGDAVHVARATCHNMHPMTETATGKKVINTHMAFHASLGVCDVSESATPQVYEDLQKVAMANAADAGYESAAHSDFACRVLSLPVPY